MDDELDEARDIVPEARQTAHRTDSPASGLRHRPLGRAATFAESTPQFARRGSSFVSDTWSESRKTLKESTDDILLPRASTEINVNHESSHWSSLPLGLALLPAVGGLFFQNGSAFITDLSLLGLAALFLNWAVRLPWDWYLSAQAVVLESEHDMETAIESESSEANSDGAPSPNRHAATNITAEAVRAQSELRLHELLALLACFVFPALGAWLLHAIRSQLSRPSESLISDYNLTIFLLAAEIRPASHLIKLVQRRTLFLQRTISAAANQGQESQETPQIVDMRKRLEELETHVANSVLISANAEPGNSSPTDELITKASSQANAELRKTFQPEVDALNRAMRRYEKRTMTSAIQVETRLQELESRLQDVVILAAATQRNSDARAGRYTTVLADWLSACIVVPVRSLFWILTWPQRMVNLVTSWLKRKLGFAPLVAKNQKGKGKTDPTRRKASKERGKQ